MLRLVIALIISSLAHAVSAASVTMEDGGKSSGQQTSLYVVGGVGVGAIALFAGYFIYSRTRGKRVAPGGAEARAKEDPLAILTRSSSLRHSPSAAAKGKLRALHPWTSGQEEGGPLPFLASAAPTVPGSPPDPTSSTSGSPAEMRDAEVRRGHRTSGRWNIPYPYPAAPYPATPPPMYSPDGVLIRKGPTQQLAIPTPTRGMSEDSLGGGSVYDEVNLETVPVDETTASPIRREGSPLAMPPRIGLERAASAPVDETLLPPPSFLARPGPSTPPPPSRAAPPQAKRLSLGLGLRDLESEMRRVISGDRPASDGEAAAGGGDVFEGGSGSWNEEERRLARASTHLITKPSVRRAPRILRRPTSFVKGDTAQ